MHNVVVILLILIILIVLLFLIKITTIITTKSFLENCSYINDIKMLYYDRIDVFKGVDVNKTSTSKECISCYYLYF